MKKVLFSTGLFLIAATSFSQKAVIKNEKGVFKQSENGSTTKFQLIASEEELAQVQEKAKNLSDRLELKIKPAGKDLYNCEAQITMQNQPQYVYKIFLTLGVESLIYEDKNKPLGELPKILESLK